MQSEEGGGDIAKDVEEKENVDAESKDATSKNHEPHLGPVKTTAGVRCVQPPGGRSSFTLG